MTNTSKQLTFCAALTLAFIILKLISLIHWSWWWILAPIWIPVVVGTIAYFILVKYIDKRNRKSNKWKKLFEDVRRDSENL